MSKISADPGQLIATGNGSFRVRAKLALADEDRYQVTNLANTHKSVVLGTDLLSPKMAHLAAYLKVIIAFNRNFDSIIKEAIREAGFPIDETKNWARWFATNFENKLRTRTKMIDEDLADEAAQHVIVQELYDRHALSKFDPNRAPKDIQAKPLDKQITWFLEYIFGLRYSEAVAFCNKQYGWRAEEDKEKGGACRDCGSNRLRKLEGGGWECLEPNCGHVSDFAVRQSPQQLYAPGEEGEYNVVDQAGKGTTPDTKDEDSQEIETVKREFYNFVSTVRNERIATMMARIFDYILESEHGKKVEFLEQFQKDTGLGGDRLKQLYKEFGGLMVAFAKHYPEEAGPAHSIIKLINDFNSKKKPAGRPMVMSFLNQAQEEKQADYSHSSQGTPPPPPPGDSQNPEGPIVEEGAPQNVPPDGEGMTPDPGEPAQQRQRVTVPPELPNRLLHTLNAALDDIVASENSDSLQESTMANTASKNALLQKIRERKTARETKSKLVLLAHNEPHEVKAAITELADFFGSIRASFLNLRENLDLDHALPKNASAKDKQAFESKYASNLRKIADESPEALGGALSEVYSLIDEAAGAVENLSESMGVNLEPPSEEMNPFEEAGPSLETPSEEPPPFEADKPEEEEVKEASGSDNWIMNNDDPSKLFGKESKKSAAKKCCDKCGK